MVDLSQKLRTGAVARLLNISTTRLRQLVSAGKIPVFAILPGGEQLFEPDAIHQVALERDRLAAQDAARKTRTA